MKEDEKREDKTKSEKLKRCMMNEEGSGKKKEETTQRLSKIYTAAYLQLDL